MSPAPDGLVTDCFGSGLSHRSISKAQPPEAPLHAGVSVLQYPSILAAGNMEAFTLQR